MQVFFLISLATGITASYCTKHISNDLRYLIGTLALISLLSSLILAPWQIKLIILTVLVFGIHRVWQHIGIGEEPEIETEDLKKLQQSQLKRLQHHQETQQHKIESQHSVNQQISQVSEPESSELTGIYRGHPCHITHSEHHHASQINYELKYRGVSITNHQDEAPQNTDK